MNSLCSRVTVVVIVVLMSVAIIGCHGSFSDVPVDYNDVSQITGGAEPFFELWDEENVITSVNVAMDGSVLLFNRKGQAAKHPDNRKGFDTYFKRSEDGGATWSDSQFIGKYIELDWKALGIGPYDGNGWGSLITRLTLGLYIHIPLPAFRVPFPLSFAGSIITNRESDSPRVQAFRIILRSQSGR